MPEPNEAEILRLRDRLHALRGEFAALTFKLQALESWVARYEPVIDELRETDRIAEAVARRMSELQTSDLTKGELRLTKLQSRAVIVGALIAFCSLLVTAALGIHGAFG